MINIQIPNNNIPEREYIIRTLFTDFLGLHYTIEVNNDEFEYSILFDECQILIQDCFFGRFHDPLSYLNYNALPEKIITVENEFTVEKDIPVIYGNDELFISENRIICGLDLFGSSFFMLTRWEEYINNTRDSHGRFPGSASIVQKNHFLHRPIVNEYVEMLWNMLKKLNYKGERKQRNYQLVLTHDIDALGYPRSYRMLMGDIFKRRNPKLAYEHFNNMFINDPYSTFDFLMTISENLGLKSHFYFMSSNKNHNYNSTSYLKSKSFNITIEKIIKRGHFIGFHPGYYTYDDPELWRTEKNALEEAVEKQIDEGRQHYLRMDVAKTLLIWDKNNMKIDSTLGYADIEGFRCGTGDIFPVFHFLSRRQLNLKERPLIIMDGTLYQYQHYSNETVLQKIQYYTNIGEKYNSKITILFHNSSFHGEWEGFKTIYKNSLEFPR